MPKLDLGGGLGGAASGAALGSSIMPGIGTGIGAVAGGLLGLFGRKKRKPKKISTLDKTQQGIYNQYAQGINGQGPMADLFGFNPDQTRDLFNRNIAQPAYEQFQEEVIPGITGQFRGGNLQNSSYLGGALAKAGTNVQRNLDTQLANAMYQGQQDSLQRRLNSINNILNMQTFAYQQPQQSSGDQVFNSLMDVGGKAAGSYFDNMFNKPNAPRAAFNNSVAPRMPLPNFQF